MDRLSIVVLAAAALAVGACKDGDSSAKPPPPTSRVNSVAAAPKKPVDLDAFCDVRPGEGDASAFAFPELAEPASSLAGKWHWVNVWATWCKPCIKEMPMLAEWKAELGSFDLAFLSIDESAEVVDAFRKDHPTTPETLRIKAADAVEDWVSSIGLDPGATIPIHVFVDPTEKVRCVRSGAIHADDRAAVVELLTH
jgi:thiol-disulfide isomerase/thioredoxin